MVPRVIAVAFLAALFAVAGPDARAASRPAVYGGSVGPLTSLLGPDAFFATADPSTHRLTGLGLTYVAACFEGSSTPVTLRVNRIVSAAEIEGGPPPAPNVLATERNGDGRVSGLIVHPDAGGGHTEVRIDGRIGARRASGTVRSWTFSAAGQLSCDTRARHWRATRRPGRIFAGTIPGAGTLVLTRNGDDDLEFHTTVWTTRCADGQTWLVPNIVITGFEIRDGRFTRPVEDAPADLAVTVAYEIQGRIGAARALGTFRGTITGIREGRATWNCSIPTGRWSTISG
jgi:hypothetical protein